MNPSSPIEPAFAASKPAPASSDPSTVPVEKPLPQGGGAPVKPDDASENAQGNEIGEEDLELSDATAPPKTAGNIKRNS